MAPALLSLCTWLDAGWAGGALRQVKAPLPASGDSSVKQEEKVFSLILLPQSAPQGLPPLRAPQPCPQLTAGGDRKAAQERARGLGQCAGGGGCWSQVPGTMPGTGLTAS